MRRSARGGGSTSWQESKGEWAETRRPGPESAADLGAWPRHVVEALLLLKADGKRSNLARAEVEIRANALRTVLHRGLVIRSDYSGYDGPREAMRLGVTAAGRLMNWKFQTWPLKFQHACDSAAVPLDLLCEMATWDSEADGDGGSCVFEDLWHRIPPWAAQWLEAAMPDKEATRDDKRRAHADIAKYLKDHRAILFTPDSKSPCRVHRRNCLVHGGALPATKRSGSSLLCSST